MKAALLVLDSLVVVWSQTAFPVAQARRRTMMERQSLLGIKQGVERQQRRFSS